MVTPLVHERDYQSGLVELVKVGGLEFRDSSSVLTRHGVVTHNAGHNVTRRENLAFRFR